MNNTEDSIEQGDKCFIFAKFPLNPALFSPTEISSWIDANDNIALCPYCEIDSVIGESSGFPITPSCVSRQKRHRSAFEEKNRLSIVSSQNNVKKLSYCHV